MPVDWRHAAVRGIAQKRAEKVHPQPGDKTPYVALEHIPNGGGRLLGAAIAGVATSHKTRFRAGDTLFGKLRPNLRKVVRADFDGVCSTDIIAVGPKSGNDPAFLYQLLASGVVYRHVMGDITGTKMPRTSWERLADLSIRVPALPEQRAIAAVLDAIDEAIERTEEVIAATERLRDALLHELLTRGLPDRHTAWREVPGLGTIPACWEVVRLGDLCRRITKGTTPTTLGHDYAPSGVRFLRVENIADGVVAGGGKRFITEDTHRMLSRSVLEENDLLLSIAGALGRSALITRGILPANVNQALAIIRLNGESRATPRFTALALRGPIVQRQIEAMRAELAQANINLQQVGSLPMPLPPLPEQRAIAGTLDSVDATIERARAERDALQSSKASTADALLTGRVRVGVI